MDGLTLPPSSRPILPELMTSAEKSEADSVVENRATLFIHFEQRNT